MLDLPPQQAGPAAHEDHTPCAQIELALAQRPQHIVDKLLRLIFYQRGDFFPVAAPLPCKRMASTSVSSNRMSKSELALERMRLYSKITPFSSESQVDRSARPFFSSR